MTRQMTAALRVEDPRHHPAEIVEELQGLLAAGAVAHSDPRHDYVYELESERRVFYLYVYPGKQRVQLLATWPRDAAEISLDPAAD